MAALPAYLVDAFTDAAFAGNPAGVVVLDEPAEPEWMQQVAAEFNHSETAFVHAEGEDFGLRWFTPTVEVELCGHATLATAHVLRGRGADRPLTFHTASGALIVTGAADGTLRLDFPSQPGRPLPAPDRLAEGLGLSPDEVFGNGIDLLVPLPDEAAVRAVVPNDAVLATIDTRGVIVTAPGVDADFASRFFGAGVGVGEDPVTGSAHCQLGPYWAGRLGRSSFDAAQVSARGGRLHVEVRGDRVLISGRAVTVLEGTLRV